MRTRGASLCVEQHAPVEAAGAGVDGGRAGGAHHLVGLVPRRAQRAVRHAQQVVVDLVLRVLGPGLVHTLQSDRHHVQRSGVAHEYNVATCVH